MENNKTIPKETISRLIIMHLKDKEISISEDVILAITKYIELFVQEATLRSIENHDNTNDDITLEYDDLEKIIGLLMLDM